MLDMAQPARRTVLALFSVDKVGSQFLGAWTLRESVANRQPTETEFSGNSVGSPPPGEGTGLAASRNRQSARTASGGLLFSVCPGRQLGRRGVGRQTNRTRTRRTGLNRMVPCPKYPHCQFSASGGPDLPRTNADVRAAARVASRSWYLRTSITATCCLRSRHFADVNHPLMPPQDSGRNPHSNGCVRPDSRLRIPCRPDTAGRHVA